MNTVPVTKALFSDLLSNSDLLAALDRQGFAEATVVQTMTLPPAIAGKDLVVQASTGSGKTLAFGLPLMSRMVEAAATEEIDFTYALVVTPTRELAVQIAEVLAGLIEGVEPVLLIGGMPYSKQKNGMKNDPRIVVGTPGRIIDFINQEFLRLDKVDYFVLDEADEMFSMGFFEDVERLIRGIPEGAQGLFVSATISPRVIMLAKKYLQDPEYVEASQHEEKPPEIEHLFMTIGSEVADKPLALCNLIETARPQSAIVFCNTRSETELVESFMRRRGFDARRINSDLNQNQRNKIMERIRSGDLRFLIATDIAARGIDIAQIELVVNYTIPEATENYVHRTGRTGRAGRKGRAVTLVSPHDFMAFQAVKKEVAVDLQEIPTPTDEQVAHARVAHLKDSLTMELSRISDTDRAVARHLFSELGGDLVGNSELEAFIAMLSRFAVEHLVQRDAVALEDELGSENRTESRSSRRDDSGGNKRGRGGDSRRRDRSRSR